VFDHELAYVCERSVGPDRTCDFRSGKIILQRPIEAEQMVKLLATGRTDLLHRFISKKGRPFSAFLVRQPDGKVGFEFAPRPAKKAAAAAKTAADAPAPASAPKPAAPRARDAAAERNVYELKPPKGKLAARKSPPRRAPAPAARVAAKRAAPSKKAARKVTPRRKPAARKRAA
jgi:DNA topoisomerase-3